MGGDSRGSIFRAFVPLAQGTELSVISFSVWQSSSEASLFVSETNYNKGLIGSGRFASVILPSLTSHHQTSMGFYCLPSSDNEGTGVERKILLSVPQTRGEDKKFFSDTWRILNAFCTAGFCTAYELRYGTTWRRRLRDGAWFTDTCYVLFDSSVKI